MDSTVKAIATDANVYNLLKYHRFENNDLDDILRDDRVSSSVLTHDSIIIGTDSGYIYIINLTGGQISRTFKSHDRPVNCISVDRQNQIIASCSDNGTAVVASYSHSNYDTKENIIHFPEQIKAICLEDSSNNSNSNSGSNSNKKDRSFIVGCVSGKLIYYQSQWFAHKNIVLFKGSNTSVTAIAWKYNFVAWSDAQQVRIMDISTQSAICYISCPLGVDIDHPLPCTLFWETSSDLLIGWADTFRHVELKPSHSNIDMSSNHSNDSVEMVAKTVVTWQSDCIICGLSTFDRKHIVMLGYLPAGEAQMGCSDGANKPEIQVINRGSGEVLFADILPIEGGSGFAGPWGQKLLSTYMFPEYCDNARKWNLFNTNTSTNSNGVTSAISTGLSNMILNDRLLTLAPSIFVLAPQVLLIAHMRDVNDRISIALKQKDYLQACTLAYNDKLSLKHYQYHDIITLYINELLDNSKAEQAAAECQKFIGADAACWERWTYAFAKRNVLIHIIPYIPISQPRLCDNVYEVVVEFFLHSNSKALLDIIGRWGAVEPGLFDHEDILMRLEALGKLDVYYLEARAKLYIMSKQYEKALNCYLEINFDQSIDTDETSEASSRFQGVFELIERHGLFDIVKDKLLNLIKLSKELSATLLIRNIDKLPVSFVTKRLQVDKPLLHWYLHTLFTCIPEQYNTQEEYRDYHVMQVVLYAEFSPEFNKKSVLSSQQVVEWSSPDIIIESKANHQESAFMTFLRTSNFAPVELALQECEKCSPPLYPEIVYLLAKMGNKKEALQLLLHEITDASQALKFIDTYDQQLWNDLVTFSVENLSFLTKLLDFIGNCDFNPAHVVSQIPPASAIPHLRQRMRRLISQYGFQSFLYDKCNDVLEDDTLSLLRLLNQRQRRAIKVDPQVRCVACARPLYITPGRINPNNSSGSSSSNSSIPHDSTIIWGSSSYENAAGSSIIFSNKIAFHRKCFKLEAAVAHTS